MKTPLRSLPLLLIGSLALFVARSQAATYTWTGTSGGSWSGTSNWTPNHVPTTGGDEALLGDVASGTRSVVVDTGLSVSTLTMTQVTGGATNLLDLQSNFTVSNAVTLSASNGGTSEIYLDVNSTGTAGHSITLTVNGGINVNNGGILALSLAGTSGQYTPNITGNVNVNGGLVVLYSNTMQTVTNAGMATISGSFSMSSGTFVIGGLMPGYSNSNLWDPRVQVNNNFTVTGGVLSASNTTLTLNGATNSITGLSNATSRISTLSLFGGGTQSMLSDSSPSNWYIATLTSRGSGGTTLKIIGSSIAGGTLGIGQLGFGQGANNGTTNVKLSSDVLATYATPIPITNGISGGAAGKIYLGLDLNGYNFFATSGGINLTNGGTSMAYWTISNSGATTGTIAANSFTFTSATQVNIGANVVLSSTLNGASNNLGLTTSGTIDPTSVFQYVVTGTGNYLGYLTSQRQVGRIVIGGGTLNNQLNISGTTLLVGGDITINKNSSLELNGQDITETGAAAGFGGLNGSGHIRNYGGALSSTATLTLNTSKATGTFSGDIYNSTTQGGAIGVMVTGGGTQVFTGVNNYTGATTITGDGSTLQLGDGTTDGSINLSNISNSGSLIFNVIGTPTAGGVISGTGSLTKTGSGMQTLSGSNTYTGATIINAGTLRIGAGGTTGSLSTSSAITDNSMLAFNRTDAVVQGIDFANAISGTGGVTQAGSGNLTLQDGNTYSGVTAVNSGTLSFGTVATGSVAQSLGEGDTINLGVSGNSSGLLQYTGAAGELDKNIYALGNGKDTIRNSGSGLLVLSGSLVKNGTKLTLAGGDSGINVTGVISGASANSDLIISTGTTTLSSVNTYNGPTYVQGGGVLVNNNASGALPTGTVLYVGGSDNSVGTFDLNGNNQTVAGLNSQGTGGASNVVTNNGTSNATLTVNGSSTFGGNIKDGAAVTSLAVTGSATTLALTGTNTYTGATTISSGTLALGANAALASGSISIGVGASFDVSSQTSGYTVLNGQTIAATSGTVRGSLNLGDGGILSTMTTGPGNGPFTAITGNLTMNGGQFIIYRATTNGIAGQNSVGGNFTMTGGTVSIGVAGGGLCSDNRFYVNGNVNITGGSIINTYYGSLFFNGGVNSITGLSSTFTGGVTLGGGNQSLVVDDTAISPTSTALTIRTSASGTVTKTVGSTTGHTLSIATLAFGEQYANGTNILRLSSDMATTSTNGVSSSFGVNGTTVNYGIDTNGHTLNLNSIAAGLVPLNVSGSSAVNWYLQNTGAGAGTISAQWFDLSKAAQVNVGLNSTNPLVLVATGTGLNNMGGSTSGTIAANSIFLYTGTGAQLTSGRALGRLAVGNGTSASTLGFVSSATETIQGDITVNNNAILNLLDKTVTETGAATGVGGLNGNGGVYNNGSGGATAVLTLNTANGNGAFSGVIGDVTSGSGKVAVTLAGGAGTQVFSGINTYTGVTTINTGNTLQLGDGTSDGVISNGSAIVNNGSLVYNIVGSQNYTGRISGTGSVTMNGAGKQILSGSNTYTGATIVSSGEMDINGTIADASAVTVNAGATLGGSGTANGTVTVQSGAINGNGLHLGATTLSGLSNLSGTTTAGSITVASGVTQNTGFTTASGDMAVSAGATVQNTGTASANIVNVENTATFTNNGTVNGTMNVSGLLNGTGTINGALTIKSSGELAPGNSPGMTTVSGNLTVETGAKISMQIEGTSVAGTDYDQILVTGASSLVTLNAGSILNLTLDVALTADQALTLIENQSDNTITGTFSTVVVNSGTYDLSGSNTFTFNGQEYQLAYNVNADNGSVANDLQLSVVPEPTTWAMLVGGVGMLLGMQHLRRRLA